MIDLMELAEKGKMPDTAIRAGIRKLLRDRIKLEAKGSREDQMESLYKFIGMMEESPVAVATDTANEQHYEVPSELFQTFMGAHLKYSCGYWPVADTTLNEAEEAMLELTCKRAGIVDGMDILELGCGWGSLSLWMAQHYPNSNIVAVSNSQTQKKYIDARGFNNLEVITADMNDFRIARRFDRVVSVEMFEHMRNWHELLARINHWLKADGKLFIHIFVHRELAYLFNDSGEVNWMAEHFFKEGMMPSENLLTLVNNDMVVDRLWRVNGRHYAKTLRAWLDNIDANEGLATTILERHHGREEARLQFGRWRIFFMACEELFGYKGGEEWYVAHYLLKKR
ncbi:Cyclopropane-fatty-acyl-phospholipid synthase [Pontiella desulfatans]|uniref:Cyclopropane-fatty-acyl-phospholipid synthase n=1 Tax=Pontiella desulfatans TaxID=2750659 RepID=A0A6C2TVD1_PONDE|nr:cyclopropane-fatty-acyl-phospholipid synthase family protein [Pontiella desulfatans]VGO11590.1 Cyclopropane-fatty-acyl-phospholipid synthase [Pontiella desulfatans]